jgi:type IX secretion system PorP/SprF family membrane protein
MKKIIIIVLIGLAGQVALAQQVPFYSQYFFNPFIYNPSFTGQSQETRAFLSHRNQWTGIQGAPVTTILTIDGPIQGEKAGLGINMYSDKTDILERSGARMAYSYKVDINSEHMLRFGLGFGIVNTKIDYDKVRVEDANDPNLFTSSQSRASVDADFGISYYW